jgi:UDP-N-acetylmuramate--alanine ligase
MGRSCVSFSFVREHQPLHLLGIGGIGVSAVARLLAANGLKISGCDVRRSSITDALENEGVQVFIGHSKEHLRGAGAVIYSSAILKDNEEMLEATNLGIPLIHRSQVLGALLDMKRGIGVSGTNGKGTVSALIAFLLDSAGQSPSYAIGAIVNDFGTNAKWQAGKYLVAEVDESDGSFANTRPSMFVINNLEADHLNYYKDLDGLLFAFSKYLQEASGQTIFANFDDLNVRKVLSRCQARTVWFGTKAGADYRLLDLVTMGTSSRFRVLARGNDLGQFELSLPGRHNAMNALAALSVVLEEGVDVERCRHALRVFRGLKNRLTLENVGEAVVAKDYISHPTGIRSTIEALKGLGKGRVVCVFKPYRFTMINYLQNEYREAFREAGLVLITEIFDAGEPPIPGIDAKFLVSKVAESGVETLFVPDMEEIPKELMRFYRRGDIFVFFGGDDLFQVAETFKKLLLKEGG